MKSGIAIVALLSVFIAVYSQHLDSTVTTILVDSTDIEFCKKNGHTYGGGGLYSTLLYCPDKYVLTDSTMVVIKSNCNNTIYFMCLVCGNKAVLDNKPRKIIYKYD